MLGGLDWNAIVIAAIAASGAWCAAFVAFLNWRSLRTPSGTRIGHIAEKTLDLSSVDVATTQAVLASVSGDPEKAARLVREIADALVTRTKTERKRGG